MTINKFIKYTSLLVFGLWMAVNPENAYAVNEKVEKEVADFSKIKMSDGNALAKGKALKLSLEQYTAKRNEIKKQFDEYDKQFTEKRAKLREVCRGTYKERLKKVGQEAGKDGKAVVDSILSDWDSAEGFWASTWAAIKGGGRFLANAVKQNYKITTTVLGLDVALDNLEDSLGQFLIETFTPGFSYTYNAEAIIKGCTFGDRAGSAYEELRSLAIQAERAASDLSYMPENIDGKNLYVYQAYAGRDEYGNPRYIDFYFLMSEDGTMTSISAVTAGCIPIPAKLAEAQSCIFCPLFKTIFNAAQSMSTKSYNALANSLANVVLVGFALLVAFKVLKNVSSFTKQDAPKFITELLIDIFKVLFAFYMLKSSTIVYDYIIGPVLKAGFEFGSSLLFAKGDGYLDSCKISTSGVQMGVMPSYLYSNLDCFIKAVQAEVAIPQSIGSTLMCVARNKGRTNLGPVNNILWDFGMMFQGLAIWIMGWIMSLAFAFYLIDATIQLGIIGALMPFLIACWPFKQTQNYTKQGWGMFMNTFFVYVFMGLVVSVNVELLGQSLTGSKGGFDEVIAALNGNEIEKLKQLLDIGFSGFLVFIACCLFAFKLTGQATDLAGNMSGGGGPQIGSKIGGLAANVAKQGVQGTTKLGLKTGKAISDKIGVTSAINKGKDYLGNKALGLIGLGRRSGAAGNRNARLSQRAAQNQNGNLPISTPAAIVGGGAASMIAQNQIKKMQETGPRRQTQQDSQNPQDSTKQTSQTQQNSTKQQGAQNPPTPNQPHSQGGGAEPTTRQQQQQTPEQLKQQLEKDYAKTANGKAGQVMIQNQTSEVSRRQKAENEAQGKMNYHNRRANEYLQKAEKTGDPAQKKNFEALANEQFNEAVKAEAALNQAKANTQKAQAELNALKQENERYKNEYVQAEMKKRQQGI